METEKQAPSVEEAVEAALEELGVTEQEAQIEIVQEPKSGLLGIGGQPAIVRVRRRARAPEASMDELEDQADAAADFLEELLGLMGLDAVAEPNVQGGHMYVDIEGDDEDDLALLIGRHGQTLEAVQELTRLVVGRRLDERIRVIVDVEDYRKRREQRLESRARDLAQKVLRSGREEELEPMNPYERKLVHDAVAEISGVETVSRGEEPNRFVVIRRR
ncbi:MAG TPA: RNA-binding cell elongation regulator Jag/EloR [Actinomycetota bacterium]|jgi:spoIIIJ-associated protein